MRWPEWAVLAAYTLALWAVAPRAPDHRTFLWARSREAAAPSALLLTASVLVTWIFAKSITNAANLGERYGLVGGLAYAAWYLSIPAAGLLIYRIRKGGHEGLVPFLTDHFGPLAAFLFSLAILIRLFNEIWSNTAVVAAYFGAAGGPAFYLGAFLFTAGVLVYSLRGGLRASIFTDEGCWYLLVQNVCKHLRDDQLCDIYDTRPQICRDYSTVNCEYEDDWVYDHYFETSEQVEEYAEAVLGPREGGTFRSPKPASVGCRKCGLG